MQGKWKKGAQGTSWSDRNIVSCFLKITNIHKIVKAQGEHSWVRKMPWKREQQPTAVFLPRESHGQRSLEGYSPRGHRASDTTTRLTLFIYFSLFKDRGLEYLLQHLEHHAQCCNILRQPSSTFKKFTRKKVLYMRFTPILPILMFFFPFWNSSLLLLPVPWWGTHVHPWLIHANEWQKPPPHC